MEPAACARTAQPRVAFFSDCYHEVNGVSLTYRQLERFIRARGIPFFMVRASAPGSVPQRNDGVFEIKRSRAAVPLDSDFSFDLMFARHHRQIRDAVREFEPEVIHITGPGDIGILGAWIAAELKIPLAISWHTNLHEFAARRLARLGFGGLAGIAEKVVLAAAVRFYRIGRVLFAPNPDLLSMLRSRTGRPAYLMSRGVDTNMFSPAKRTRTDASFTFGYVGRLTPEKNVRQLARLSSMLDGEFRFLILGDGGERNWLAANVAKAELPGVLRGEDLARAYANMDAFLFPSHTDTFGNVVLEAMASGVAAVVTSDGGPKFLVENGITGYVAQNDDEWLRLAAELYRNREAARAMSIAAREQAFTYSWDAVFQRLFEAYSHILSEHAGCNPLSRYGANAAPGRMRALY